MDASSVGHIFTIGHGGRTAAALVEQLRQAGVRYVVDVRSIPYSRHQPDFRKEPLDRFLAEKRLRYVFMGDLLGGRSSDRDCYTDGKVDYANIRGKKSFRHGIALLLDASNQGSDPAPPPRSRRDRAHAHPTPTLQAHGGAHHLAPRPRSHYVANCAMPGAAAPCLVCARCRTARGGTLGRAPAPSVEESFWRRAPTWRGMHEPSRMHSSRRKSAMLNARSRERESSG